MTARFAEVPIDKIRLSTVNPRFEAREIESLTASIRALGVLEPLLVARIRGDADHVELIAGFRRFTAAKRAGLRTVPARLLPAASEADHRITSLTENLHRLDMTPIEKGEAYIAIANERGLSQRDVAKLCKVTDFEVSKLTQLVRKACPELRQAVHEGKVPLAVAYDLLPLTHDMQRARLRRRAIVNKVGTANPGSNRDGVTAAIQRAMRAARDEDWPGTLYLLEQAIVQCKKKLPKRG